MYFELDFFPLMQAAWPVLQQCQTNWRPPCCDYRTVKRQCVFMQSWTESFLKNKTSSAFQLLGFLDPEKKLFSHRILSRDECIDPFSKTGNLRWVLWNMENISTVKMIKSGMIETFHLSTRLQQSQRCSDSFYTVCKNVEALTCKSLNSYQTFGCSFLMHLSPNRNLFPCGDSMVCIIDDREDVWKFAPNLITVKKYVYFQGTGDINALPGSREAQTERKGTMATHIR